ncbi:MAG: hypothetical protein L6Q55_01525 [Azonexus sp.]|nr:hypothetical protein [Azonexus sp.]MCK6411088.1 hypothetical protein [Azonexus sp.]
MNIAWRRQRGLGVIAAIVVLVILAALAAGIVAFSSGQQRASALDAQSVRAWQAAKAGNEWGVFQVLNGVWRSDGAANPCPVDMGAGNKIDAAPLDLTALTGFRVQVSVQCWRYKEGSSELRLYRVESIACNAPACDTAADASVAGYVERRRVVMVTGS